MPSRYIRVHERDNVAIIVDPDGSPAGTEFPGGLIVSEHIPQAHKVALQDLNPGEPVIRYGEIIGTATRTIKAGSWVHEDLVALPAPPPLEALPLATAVPAAQPPLAG